MDGFELTVSIVNHNNGELLAPLLKSILDQTRSVSYEVFVVDNASDDGSAEMIRERFPEVNLVCNEHPKGFAENHNAVLELASGQYVVLLNDDMLLENDALGKMVAFMESDPEVGAAGCKLLNTDGSLQRSAWIGFPSPRALLIDLFYLSVLLPGAGWVKESEAILLDQGQPVEVDHVLGACLLVRSETIEQVGALDSSFFMYLEETDWCYRMKQEGWKVFWIPEAKIVHYGQQSVRRNLRRFVPMRYRNYCRFCRKHGCTNLEMLALKLIIVGGSILRALLWGLRGLRGRSNGYAMMRGYLQVLLEVFSF
jgi:GT2 family glycosyltransferase